MSWNSPATVAELAASIRARFSFHSSRFALAADHVAVCSVYSDRAQLDASHPLSARVLDGSERYHAHYMGTRGAEARTPAPDVALYYLRRGRRAVLAILADGTVLDELDTLRGIAPRTREAIREAAHDAARRQTEQLERDAAELVAYQAELAARGEA